MSTALAAVRLTEVLRMARMRDASDVHLAPETQPVLRIDGRLERLSTGVVCAPEIDRIAGAVLDAHALEHLKATGDASTTHRDEEFGDCRVHAYRSSRGIVLAIRLLARTLPTLESLELPSVVARLSERPNGLVLFTGPTGSGKSTALAAVIDRINRSQSRHVVTIEDPVEYEHRSDLSIVSQREVGRDVPSFAVALKGALRSDPDVILLGEMRDYETMHAALAAAETGHLVFATLHTGDATQTIDRVIGSFPADAHEHVRIQLAQTLLGVLCLRLVPRSRGSGRRCAVEVLVANDAVGNVIREGKTHQLRNIIATGRNVGMQTLESHLSELVMHHEIDLEVAKQHALRPSEVRAFEPAAG